VGSIPIARSKIAGNKALTENLAPETSHLMLAKDLENF
jgi:hypothetical protein